MAHIVTRMFEPSAMVPGDDFFRFIDQGHIAPWRPEAQQQNETVVKGAAASAGGLAARGHTVVYDGIVAPSFLESFRQVAARASLHYVVLLPPEQQCQERVRSRGRHGFTDLHAARRMYREFADADIDPRHLVTSTGTPTDIGSAILGAVRAGSLLCGSTAPTGHRPS